MRYHSIVCDDETFMFPKECRNAVKASKPGGSFQKEEYIRAFCPSVLMSFKLSLFFVIKREYPQGVGDKINSAFALLAFFVLLFFCSYVFNPSKKTPSRFVQYYRLFLFL